jgi:hypothetical protein
MNRWNYFSIVEQEAILEALTLNPLRQYDTDLSVNVKLEGELEQHLEEVRA